MSGHETYPIEIAGVKRDLRLFEIKPGLKIAILNILGDTELVQAAAKALAIALQSVMTMVGIYFGADPAFNELRDSIF